MYKKSLKKSNSKKNNKSFKKHLGENNKITDKILELKKRLDENSHKIKEITYKLVNIVIKNPSKKTRDHVRDLKEIISNFEFKLKEYNTQIKKLEVNPPSLDLDKKIINKLDTFIKEMDKINDNLDSIIYQLNKGFSYKVIKFIKKELFNAFNGLKIFGLATAILTAYSYANAINNTEVMKEKYNTIVTYYFKG